MLIVSVAAAAFGCDAVEFGRFRCHSVCGEHGQADITYRVILIDGEARELSLSGKLWPLKFE
jgi:hypothetical protein